MKVITKDKGVITLTDEQVDIIRSALKILKGNLELAGAQCVARAAEAQKLVNLFSE